MYGKFNVNSITPYLFARHYKNPNNIKRAIKIIIGLFFLSFFVFFVFFI